MRGPRLGLAKEIGPRRGAGDAFVRRRSRNTVAPAVEASANACQASGRRAQSHLRQPVHRRETHGQVRLRTAALASQTTAECSNESHLARALLRSLAVAARATKSQVFTLPWGNPREAQPNSRVRQK